MKKWFEMKAMSETEAEVSIFDEIGGWGISARDFEENLKALGAFQKLTINISSPGGSCVEGNHIYNILAAVKAEKTAKILGYACSMASVIAMAADKIIMPDNTFLMIHNPWMSSGGDAEQLRKDADLLDKVKAGILAAYTRRSSKTEAEISALMDAETWLSASEAAEVFNSVEVVESLQVAAMVKPGDFKSIPAAAAIWQKQDEPAGAGEDAQKAKEAPADGNEKAEDGENAESGESVTPSNSANDYERGKLDGRIEGAEAAKAEVLKLRKDAEAMNAKIELWHHELS